MTFELKSSSEVLSMALASRDIEFVQAAYDYAVNKRLDLVQRGKVKRAAMWERAFKAIQAHHAELYQECPPAIETRPCHSGKRQKYTGLLISNMQGLSRDMKAYLSRSHSVTKRQKNADELYAVKRAYEEWKSYGTMPEYCINPCA